MHQTVYSLYQFRGRGDHYFAYPWVNQVTQFVASIFSCAANYSVHMPAEHRTDRSHTIMVSFSPPCTIEFAEDLFYTGMEKLDLWDRLSNL